MTWNGAVAKDARRTVFYLIGQARPDAGEARLRWLAEGGALALPQPALAVAGEYAEVKGQLAVLAADHLYGRAITSRRHGQRALRERSTGGYRLGFQTATLASSPPNRSRCGSASARRTSCGSTAGRRGRSFGRLCGIRLPKGHHVLTGAPRRPGSRRGSGGSGSRSFLARPQAARGGLGDCGEESRPTRRGAAGSNGRQGRRKRDGHDHDGFAPRAAALRC